MKKRRKKQSTKKSYTCRILGLIMAITVIAILGGVLLKRSIMESPEDTLVEYMNHVEKKEYEAMYAMIDSGEKGYLEKEEYMELLGSYQDKETVVCLGQEAARLREKY